jgi:hypothetical protein
MANPNIVNVTAIYGLTTYLTPSSTSAVVLLANTASSGKIYKINQLTAANVSGSAVTVTVSIYTNGAVAQGSAPSGGTAYPIISGVSVPSTASLIVVDKSSVFYLQEGTSITVTSGTGSGIAYTLSYEDIS